MKRLLFSLFILTSLLTVAQPKATLDSVSVYFEFNSSEVSFKNVSNADVKAKLSQLKGQELVLRAYTDSIGAKEYNLKLAQNRLESVKSFLEKSYPGRFSIRTEMAVGEDLSSKADAAKRRVDILVDTATPNIRKQATGKKRTFELNVPIRLEIQFVYGRDEILRSSYEDIQFLMETLQADNTLHVTLAGHVCCGTDGQNLSGKRAERIKQILVMEGNIPASRITAVGFGNKKPLFVEDSEANRQANRRVEATFYKK